MLFRSYFGTDTFAAPLLGIIASITMLFLGLSWLNYRLKKAKASGEGYGNHKIDLEEKESENLPGIFISVAPILIIFVTNFALSKIYYPNIDGSYLVKYGVSLDNVSGTWSVIISIVIAIIFILALNFKKLPNLNDMLNIGVKNSFLPLLNSSAIVGYGSIIKSLPIFLTIQNTIMNISSNPIISEAISVNVI